MKRVIWTILLFTFLIPLSYACTSASNNLYINNDTIFCNNQYSITGMTINKSNIVIQCNNTVLIGTNRNVNAFEAYTKKNITIFGCNFTKFSSAIAVWDTNYTTVFNNTGTHLNGFGVSLYNSRNAEIYNNDFRNVRNNGVDAYQSSNSRIYNNTIMFSNDSAISTEYSNNVIIHNNSIVDSNSRGIHANNQNNLSIFNNKLYNTFLIGIHLRSTDGIQVINNVLNNTGYKHFKESGEYDEWKRRRETFYNLAQIEQLTYLIKKGLSEKEAIEELTKKGGKAEQQRYHWDENPKARGIEIIQITNLPRSIQLLSKFLQEIDCDIYASVIGQRRDAPYHFKLRGNFYVPAKNERAIVQLNPKQEDTIELIGYGRCKHEIEWKVNDFLTLD